MSSHIVEKEKREEGGGGLSCRIQLSSTAGTATAAAWRVTERHGVQISTIYDMLKYPPFFFICLLANPYFDDFLMNVCP